MATTKRVTPGREGYKILFNENTVIMNHKFAAAAAKYGTKENDLMKKIRTDFPGMKELIVSGREQTNSLAIKALVLKIFCNNLDKSLV